MSTPDVIAKRRARIAQRIDALVADGVPREVASRHVWEDVRDQMVRALEAGKGTLRILAIEAIRDAFRPPSAKRG